MPAWEAAADGVRLRVRLQPGAKADRIDGPVNLGDGTQALKVRVTAPARDGKANAALIGMLAKRWKRPKSAVTITAGTNAREKTLFIAGDSAELAARLHAESGDSNETKTEG